jgi:outer membrane protein OmpA-like peptidoglycan-associated protein
MYFKKFKDFITEAQTVPQNGNQGTNGIPTTLSDPQLQESLNKWNSEYSQEFKFLNNMPKTVGSTNTLEELLLVIVDDSKMRAKVKEGITKLVEFFKNKNIIEAFKDKELLIIGYTSSTGTDSYNKALSFRRAKIVGNAIRSVMTQNKLENIIKLKEEGMGEDPAGLIVINDQNLDPIKLGANAPKLSEEILELLKDSKEERQKINRRVKITLPEFKMKEAPIQNIVPIETVKVEDVQKPILPEANKITFNFNSFILKKEAISILTQFSNDLKKWNEKEKEPIKTIYISSHTLLGKGGAPTNKDNKDLKNSLVILSANRGQYVKDFIRSIIGEDTAKNITITVYPVAYEMGEEKKVVINFEKGNHMERAEEIFNNLASEYNIPVKNNSLANLAVYIENEPLLRLSEKKIRYTISQNTNDKCIPIELFYDNLEGYKRFNRYTEFRNKCKEKLSKIINSMNKKTGRGYTLEDFVYKPE